jgi:tetratricopeptide (TPR) repeat protein
VSVLLLATALGAAPAAPPPSPLEICGKFIVEVKTGDYPEAARAKVLALWEREKKAKAIDPQFIRKALGILEYDFGRAVLRVRADRLEEAGAILERLARKPRTPYLAAAVAVQQATIAARERDWPKVADLVAMLRGGGRLAACVLCRGEVELLAARALAAAGKLDEAIRIARALGDLPEARTLTARWEARRDGVDLDKVAREMDGVKGDLDKTLTGPPTRDRQDRVVAMLDALIEMAEEAESGQQGGCPSCGGSSCPGGKQCPGNQGGPPKGTGIPSSPASTSALVGGKGTDPGKAASSATMRDYWAKLPPKERARVLDTLRRRFPRRYKQLIEEYYKALAEGENR